MITRPKNILLTGPPSVGKTTIIKKIAGLVDDAKGFYTEEIRSRGKRVGFRLKTLNGREGILAHIDIKSRFRVGKYGVNIEDLEDIGVRAIEDGLQDEECRVIILDEIGKMELFSRRFKDIVIEALNSEKLLIGTIKLKGNGFIEGIKQRNDTIIIQVTYDNRENIPPMILRRLNFRIL